MKYVVKSSSQDDFIKKSMKDRKIKKFIHDSVKDNPRIKEEKARNEALNKQRREEGKEYRRDLQDWV